MPAISAQSMRRTETPNAAMTTIASPSQGPASELSVWKVAMRAGQQGPLHVFDRELVWHVVSGEADFALGEQTHRLHAGDAIVLPAGAQRQVTAVTATEIIACGPAAASAWAAGAEETAATPPWVG